METDHLLLRVDLQRTPTFPEQEANLKYLERIALEQAEGAEVSATAAGTARAAAESARDAANQSKFEAAQSKADAAASAVQALDAKQDIETLLGGASQPDAGALTGDEAMPTSRGTGLLKTTLTKIAQWVLQAYQGFTQNGAGAAARTVQDELRDRVSVRQFITTPVDGTTSNQAGIAAAVAYAYSVGAILEWPRGTYVSTESIPNFHDVTHIGKGVIKRGADIYRPSNSGSNLNTLYVSAAGTGDGLSASTSSTLNAVALAMKLAGPVLGGKWQIVLSAETHAAPAEWFSGLVTNDYIIFKGPDVAGGVPVAIVDAGGISGREQALRFVDGTKALLRDVRLINALATSVASGAIFDRKAQGRLENVHTLNTQWAGVNFNEAGDCVVVGGVFDGSTYGVRSYGGTIHSVGSATGRPQFKNCTGAGFIAQGASYGHVDFCDFIDCGVGISHVFQSHSASTDCTFTNCATAWQCDGNSTISPKNYTITGGARRERHRTSPNMADDQPYRFEAQFHPASGVNGRSAYGYTDWVVPNVKYQYSNNGTSAGFSLAGYASCTSLWESNGSTYLGLAAASTANTGIWFGDEVHAQRGEIKQNGGALLFAFSASNAFRMRSSDFAPFTDNTKTNGTASLRWSTVYAGTSTINTSDAREKQQVRDLSESERAVALRLKPLMRIFKFNDAVAQKGDAARWHAGILAQDVQAAFEAEGLDGFQYAVLCYDEWADEYEPIYAERHRVDAEGNPEIEADGQPAMELYDTGEKRLVVAAGNRYGVRYDELLAFIIAAL
ncbi:tail fiber domain-containing protein [Cupriavidus alkaliphilus]|uniref:Peptidase S74 domain-containing protein n=1 Tax=Cupriavidus alkaliphilus TaxID=942866 RepID=A0A7W4YUT5_9BURK|nr:tail fiber domain-containing protein [Cupriavidus alkaliphilus]MBB3010636.1 hypothetical protein [Cupriavidus alkaliphilus]